MLSKFVRSYGAVKRVLKRRLSIYLLTSLSGYRVNEQASGVPSPFFCHKVVARTEPFGNNLLSRKQPKQNRDGNPQVTPEELLRRSPPGWATAMTTRGASCSTATIGALSGRSPNRRGCRATSCPRASEAVSASRRALSSRCACVSRTQPLTRPSSRSTSTRWSTVRWRHTATGPPRNIGSSGVSSKIRHALPRARPHTASNRAHPAPGVAHHIEQRRLDRAFPSRLRRSGCTPETSTARPRSSRR